MTNNKRNIFLGRGSEKTTARFRKAGSVTESASKLEKLRVEQSRRISFLFILHRQQTYDKSRQTGRERVSSSKKLRESDRANNCKRFRLQKVFWLQSEFVNWQTCLPKLVQHSFLPQYTVR